jgi:hypothetical protein
MTEEQEIFEYLMSKVGEGGCGADCETAEIHRTEDGFELQLGGFMEPWFIGRSVEEAKQSIDEYLSQGFGTA